MRSAHKPFPNITKDQKGSVILAILSMAAIGSIAMLTMMLSIKSLNKSLTLETLQNKAHQVLLSEHEKTISSYQLNTQGTDIPHSSIIKEEGIEYNYTQFPNQIQYLNSPIPGFSHDSNYASKLIRFKSQITKERVQSHQLFTEIACIDVVGGYLKTNKQKQYTLQMASLIDDSLLYEFDDETGQIWKITANTSKLFIDLGFNSNQTFSRVDFATLKVSDKLKFAMIFTVYNTENSSTNHPNTLYIVFDELFADQPVSMPFSTADLVQLIDGHASTGDEPGFAFTLDPGHLLSSAITSVHNQIIMFAQTSKSDPQSSKAFIENKLYRINLTVDNHRNQGIRITTQPLSDSVKTQLLVTKLSNPNQLIIGTESDPFLVSLPVHCKRISVYEK